MLPPGAGPSELDDSYAVTYVGGGSARSGDEGLPLVLDGAYAATARPASDRKPTIAAMARTAARAAPLTPRDRVEGLVSVRGHAMRGTSESRYEKEYATCEERVPEPAGEIVGGDVPCVCNVREVDTGSVVVTIEDWVDTVGLYRRP
ncbi:hypothetical protein PsYK624_053960 [Phanerochaete sordida]|uniref:Uncharacterized protein n=1 Tax=Phanerochaete sordida TaxID=48140 RepID=A0A9P3G8F2_9APHY|nr:hypothetical protein PsYK624_053960 [Phanerochaete sordida]